MSATVAFAMQVARRWQEVPDEMTDEVALEKSIITPEMLELIMAVVTSLLAECLANSQVGAFRRMKSYLNEKNPLSRLGDDVALLRRIDLWVGKLAIPRESGDVKVLRHAIVAEAGELDEAAFQVIHREQLFLAI